MKGLLKKAASGVLVARRPQRFHPLHVEEQRVPGTPRPHLAAGGLAWDKARLGALGVGG